MRRREPLSAAAASRSAPAPAPQVGSSSAGDTSRQLTVLDLRQAERAPPVHLPAAPVVHLSRKVAVAATREAAASLHTWLARHPHLRQVPVERGEPSVALLLLWEADHGHLFPSRVTEMKQRLCSFTRIVVAADHALSLWLESKVLHVQLSPGVPFNKW